MCQDFCRQPPLGLCIYMLINFCFSPVNVSCTNLIIRPAKEPRREEEKFSAPTYNLLGSITQWMSLLPHVLIWDILGRYYNCHYPYRG